MIRLDGPSGSFYLFAGVTRPTRVESRTSQHRPLFQDSVSRRPPNTQFGTNIWRSGVVRVQTEVFQRGENPFVRYLTGALDSDDEPVTYNGELVTHNGNQVVYDTPKEYNLSDPAPMLVTEVRSRARQATHVSTPYWQAEVMGCTSLIVRPVGVGFVLEMEWIAVGIGPPAEPPGVPSEPDPEVAPLAGSTEVYAGTENVLAGVEED